MTTTHHLPSDPSAGSDSPTSDRPPPPPARWHPDVPPDTITSAAPRIRLMCSFGGRILPRPHDNQLRYVGGDTRIVAFSRHSASFSSLLSKLSKLIPNPNPDDDLTIKYQLPNEDLDALITVQTDEDVDNMMEEYDRLVGNNPNNSKASRIRLFLFSNSDNQEQDGGGGGAFGSVLSGTGVSKHESWFVDALNGRRLERGTSVTSSILSEVPDYLFGLDNNSDEPTKSKTNVSVSDPGSPAPHYGSTSSVPSVEIKSEVVNEPDLNVVAGGGGYVQNPVWQYVNEPPLPVPFYYVHGPGPVQGGSLPVQPVPMRMPSYVRPGPVAYRPVYVGGPVQVGGPAHEYAVGMEAGGGISAANNTNLSANPGVVPMMYRPPPPVGLSPGAGAGGCRQLAVIQR